MLKHHLILVIHARFSVIGAIFKIMILQTCLQKFYDEKNGDRLFVPKFGLGHTRIGTYINNKRRAADKAAFGKYIIKQ